MNNDIIQWIQVAPKLDNLELVTLFVEDGMSESGVSKKVITKFDIAIDELFSNIVYYSGADKVEAGYGVSHDEAVLVLKDNGKQYNPLEKEKPDVTLAAEDRPIGGLGICIVKNIMDDMQYTRRNEQNILIIKKNI